MCLCCVLCSLFLLLYVLRCCRHGEIKFLKFSITLVIISSKSVPTRNRFDARRANGGKMTSFKEYFVLFLTS